MDENKKKRYEGEAYYELVTSGLTSSALCLAPHLLISWISCGDCLTRSLSPARMTFIAPESLLIPSNSCCPECASPLPDSVHRVPSKLPPV